MKRQKRAFIYYSKNSALFIFIKERPVFIFEKKEAAL